MWTPSLAPGLVWRPPWHCASSPGGVEGSQQGMHAEVQPGRLGWGCGTSIPGGSPGCAGQVGLGGRPVLLRWRDVDTPALEQGNSGKIAGGTAQQ